MPDRHAILGPSGAHRWLICTPSARLEYGIPDSGSTYAKEGTLAHHIGELLLRKRWQDEDITAAMEQAKADPLYSGSMLEHMEGYADFVEERMAEAATRCADPRIFIEQTIRFDEYVPEAFGTADCLILSDGLLDVIDLKYGKGVPVQAEENPQMRMYGLGCYLALSWAYEISTIRMTIYQPRLDNVSVATMTAKELLDWAENYLKPRAALAWEGKGEFCPNEEACRWCRAAPICRANRDYQLEIARHEFTDPALLTDEEVAEVLTRRAAFKAWVDSVHDYAEKSAINLGVHYPGFKLVEGKSNRKYTDEEAIAKVLRKAGYKVADIYKPRELLGLTAMEKMVGKKKFGELAGEYVIKPTGAPALVAESDRRPALNSPAKAAEDFDDDFKEEN